MFHMCQEVQLLIVFIAAAPLCWAAPPAATAHAGQTAGFPQRCPAGDEVGFFQTHVDAHNLSDANPSAALDVFTEQLLFRGETRYAPIPSTIAELRNVLVELNNSNSNEEFPGFGGIVGHMVEVELCKKASILAKPAITKCESTLAKVTHHVDQLLNGTLEAHKALTESNGNSSHDLAARLEQFENYSNRALGLGVQQLRTMYDMLNPMAALATQALEEAGMHSLAHNLRLDEINKTLNDVLHVYQAAQHFVHGIGNKSENDVGATLRRLNETMKTGLSGVDAFALALNTSFVQLTEGLGTGLTSLLPKSCNSIWKRPLASAELTVKNISLKVHDSVHRLASDLMQAGEHLGIQVSPAAAASKSGGSRSVVSGLVGLSAMAAAAALAGLQ